MSLITVIFVAFGLAMDSFAVSIASGITIKNLKINNALKVAFSFGLFQAFMPLVGWLAGLSLREISSGIDHWIAFALLILIGLKMIYESLKIESASKGLDSLNIYILLMLSIATSIDALAVGLSFAFLKIYIVTPVIIIGIVTFLLSLLGIVIGNKLGHFFEKKIEIAGGLILIGIGIKILIEHLV